MCETLNFRQPIECQVDPSFEKYTKQIETRCWIEGTYIIREQLNGIIGKNLVNYGIGTRLRHEERIYQTYYQWVTPTFLIMSMIFYFPQFLWKNWEGGTMDKLLKDIGEFTSTGFPLNGERIKLFRLAVYQRGMLEQPKRQTFKISTWT